LGILEKIMEGGVNRLKLNKGTPGNPFLKCWERIKKIPFWEPWNQEEIENSKKEEMPRRG